LMLAEAIKRNPKASRIQAKTTETKKNHSVILALFLIVKLFMR